MSKHVQRGNLRLFKKVWKQRHTTSPILSSKSRRWKSKRTSPQTIVGGEAWHSSGVWFVIACHGLWLKIAMFIHFSGDCAKLKTAQVMQQFQCCHLFGYMHAALLVEGIRKSMPAAFSTQNKGGSFFCELCFFLHFGHVCWIYGSLLLCFFASPLYCCSDVFCFCCFSSLYKPEDA